MADEPRSQFRQQNRSNLRTKFALITAALAQNTRLTTLSFDSLNLRPETTPHVKTMLKSLTNLVRLAMGGNLFTKDNIKEMSTVIVPSKKLMVVDFTDNDYTGADVGEFLEIWKHNYSAQILRFISHGVMMSQFDINFKNLWERNTRIQWNNIHPLIVDCFFGFASRELPVYVMLWILDWLEPMSLAVEWRHFEKVRLLERLVESRRRVLANRGSTNASNW
jgi:hypothetical protein